MKLKLFYVALFLSMVTEGYPQFSLTGELRPRTEYRHGFRTLIDSAQYAGIFTSQRTRLNFGYSHEKFKSAITLQDVRTWGNQSQLNLYDANTSSLHEAWGEYSFMNKLSLKAGRQELNYDDERLLGGVGWLQQGRSHDAMLLKFSDDSMQLKIHIGGAYNQTAENNIATSYTGINNYKEMYFLWLNKKINDISISILEINNGIQSPVSVTSTRFSYTAGTHVEYRKDAIFINPRYYFQGGVDANKKDIRAYMSGLDLQYTVKKKIMIGLGAEISSGQNQTDTTKAYKDVTRNFNPLYGTGHKFNGYMDYFFAGSAHGNIGLNNFYLKTRYKAEKWWVALDVHQFMANADVLDKKELASTGNYKTMNSNLGTEIDLTFAYNLNGNFTLQAGYSHLLATETMESLKGGRYDEMQNWAYLMLIFKPVFLK
ncbi:MAG: alginate export family protein [Bacteroidetes bacterium]|nr:alginate export family protein [Bacteroidota bacterium]